MITTFKELIYWTGGSEEFDANKKKLLFFVVGVFTATAKQIFLSAAAALMVKCLVFSRCAALLRLGRELQFRSWTPRISSACVCVRVWVGRMCMQWYLYKD